MRTKKLITIGLQIAAAITLSLPGAALAQHRVGLKLGLNGNGDQQSTAAGALLPTDSAGAPGYEQVNWNVLGRYGNNSTNSNVANAYAVLDSNGDDAHLVLQWDATGTYGVQGGAATDQGDPNKNLMDGYLDSNNTGNVALTNGLANGIYGQANANKPLVYLSGIQAWLATEGASQYDLVIYMDGDNQAGRTGEYWVQNASGPTTNLVFGADMTTHVFVRDFNNFTANPVYQQVPVTANFNRMAGAGNYVVFPGLSADSLLIRTAEYNTRCPINAVQLIPRTTAVGATIDPVLPCVTYTGGTAAFRANVGGALPFTYQWQKNGVNLTDGGNISGATTATLKISGVTSADAGSYTVVVTNPGGISTSTAQLTVTTPAAGSYAQQISTNAPVAYWRFNETGDPSTNFTAAYDSVGGFNAVYGPLAQNAYNGIAGPRPGAFPGFEADNGALQTFNSSTTPLPYPSSYVNWAVAPPLNLNTNTVTVCGWIYPTAYTEPGFCTFLFCRNGNDTSGLGYGNNNNLGYTWNGTASSYNFVSGLVPASNQWSFVALVVSPTNAIIYLYNSDGQFSATNTIVHTNGPFAGFTLIGDDPSSTTTPQNRAFTGSIDELAVFNRCLSDQDLYLMYKKGLNVGIVLPSITAQPRSTALFEGRTATFRVTATGDRPLSYQWRSNGVAIANGGRISGANTPTLVITNVALTDAATFDVVVDNVAHQPVVSSPATLTVIPAGTPGPYESTLRGLGPVSYWRFNEPNGSLYAYDYWGGIIATNENLDPSGASGPRPPDFNGFESANAAGNYDGLAADTDTQVSGMLNNLPQFSVAGWFNIPIPASTRKGLFGQNDVVEFGFHAADASGAAQLGVWTAGGGGAYLPQSLVTPGQWYFTAAVGSGSSISLYLLTTNGSGGFVVSQATTSSITTNYGSSAYPFRIAGGGILDATGNNLYGLIDEVAVFRRALSAGELSSLFAAALGVSSLPPQITLQPVSTTLYAGRTATLTVNVVGSAPLYYEWRTNGVALADGGNVIGSGTATLMITNITAANAGDYELVITNSAGAITSSVATLSVIAPSTGSYEAAVIALNPLAYYRLNEMDDPSTGTAVTHEYWGGHAGVYGAGAQNGFNGIQGPRPPDFLFENSNTALATSSNAPGSYATAPIGSLSTNLATFTMWINPSGPLNDYAGLLVNRNSGVAGGFGYTGGQIGYTWNNNNANTYNFRSGLVPPLGVWSFVALVVTPTNAIVYMMNSSGIASATNVVAHTADVFGNNWQIGRDDINNNLTDAARVFVGSIDEVAVFTYALTPAQLQTLYAAGSPVGPVNITIQLSGTSATLTWPVGTLQQADAPTGPWASISTATSPYTVPTQGLQKYYRVKVR